MYKTLCLAVLLLPTFALTQGRNPAVTPISPPIVAKGKLVHQSAPIPTTTIFTPLHDGLYRLSVYMTQSVAVIGSGAQWTFNVAWSDDAGDEVAGAMLYLQVNAFPPGAYGNLNGGSPGNTLLLQAKAGKVITYSTTLVAGTDGGAYSLYYTLERIE
jgi:hypothetical protein